MKLYRAWVGEIQQSWLGSGDVLPDAFYLRMKEVGPVLIPQNAGFLVPEVVTVPADMGPRINDLVHVIVRPLLISTKPPYHTQCRKFL